MKDYCPDALDARDPAFIEALLPLLESFNARYLRLRSEGTENAPAGPTMFVANHNGGIVGPDLFCTLATLWRLFTPKKPLYALAHDFAMRQFTPLGRVLQRAGAVAACRDNARRVLDTGGQLLVYPGGDLDAYRRFDRRNEVVILPRTGFVEVARSVGVPIVPIVTRGAHRSACVLFEGEAIASALRMRKWARLERFPIALALPWIVALGPWLPYFPLPFPVSLRVLQPVYVAAREDTLAAATRIQSLMQSALLEMA